MKKTNFLSCLIMAIVIVFFITEIFIQAVQYVNNEKVAKYLYSDKYNNKDLVYTLKEYENIIKTQSESMKQRCGEDYPVIGAWVYSKDILQTRENAELIIKILIAGAGVGIIYYAIQEVFIKKSKNK